MDVELTWLLGLRLQHRGDRAAVAVIDRCLVLLTTLDAANDEGRAARQALVRALMEDVRRQLAELASRPTPMP